MNLVCPFPLSKISQRFGQNAVDLYARDDLKGHTALDIQLAYGTPLPAFCDGQVYSTINDNNPDPMRYRAVYQLVDDGIFLYEVSYGHLNKIYVMPGQFVRAGDIIGTVGNSGEVWSNGNFVTREEKLAGSKAGAHLHGPQVRPVIRTKELNGTALMDANGTYRDTEGYYYQVKDPKNGYAGCIDPMSFFEKPSDRIAVMAEKEATTSNSKMAGILKAIVALLKAWDN